MQNIFRLPRPLMVLMIGIAMVAVSACGAPEPGSGGDNGNQDNNSNGNAEPAGDVSVVDAEAESDDGEEWSGSGEKPSDEVGGDDESDGFSAFITGSELDMTLVTDDGTILWVIIDTSEDETAPGSFSVSSPLGGTWVEMTDFTGMGDILDSVDNGGTVALDTCPQSVGDAARGSFNDVTLESAFDDTTFTLNGSFDVAVAGVMGELYCEEATNNSTANNQQNNDTPGECGWVECDPEGECCEYLPCMNQCDQECLFEDPDCAGGMDPVACAECVDECYTNECEISDACIDAADDADSCAEANNCDQAADEEEELECLEQNCCDELNTAF